MQLPAIGVEGSEDFDVEVCRCLRSLAHVQICRCFCLLVKILFPYGVCESLVCHGRSSSVKRVVVCRKPTHKEVLFAPENVLIGRHRDASLGAEHVPPIM